MRWSRKYFSNYGRWEFEFNHLDYPIYLVIKLHARMYRQSYWRATWRTDRMRGSQFEVEEKVNGRAEIAPKRRALFKKLRTSLSYGLNVKGRAAVERLMASNGQHLPHKKSQISGK